MGSRRVQYDVPALGGPCDVSGLMATLRTVDSRREQCGVAALEGPFDVTGLMTAFETVGFWEGQLGIDPEFRFRSASIRF